jgi:hypothetical protein
MAGRPHHGGHLGTGVVVTGRSVSSAICAALFMTACASTTGGTGLGPSNHATSPGRATVPGEARSGDTAASAAITTTQQHGPINPCALLTKAEVDHAAGTKTGATVRARDTCTYPTPTTAKFGQLNVYVGLGAKKIYDVDRKVLKHHFVSVSGIGDQAHLEEDEIFFRVGSTWIAVQLARLDDVAKGPLLEDIARAAVGRL